MKIILEKAARLDLRMSLLIIFLIALGVRVLFYFFGIPVYYGSSGVQLGGDFGAWARSIQNLVEHGQYTSALGHPAGPFFRPPGYGFFLLPFYLIFGNWEDALVWIAAVQILLDAAAAAVLFKALFLLTASRISAWIGGLLYCFYFFALGWTPVLYPEAPSNFFVILGFCLFVRAVRGQGNSALWAWFAFGASWGIAALLRIQLLVMLLVPPLVILWQVVRFGGRRFLPLLAVFLGMILTYGLWPARNIINYGEPVFIQRLAEGGVWSRDCTAFFGLLKAIQVDHQPQFDQVLARERVEWPSAITWTDEEKAKIETAIVMMHQCGRGTQKWKVNEGFGVAKDIDAHCDDEIAAIWQELTIAVKARHPFYTAVTVPLMNLSKCFFKNSLEKQATPSVVRVAFAGRTLLVLLGLANGLWLLFYGKREVSLTACLIILSAAAVYLSLSFVARHIEMRYLLQADVLLLIPLAAGAGHYLEKSVFGISAVHSAPEKP